MINHSKYQDMLVCQKTTNLFIIFACGLVLLMPDCLFFYNTCSRNVSGVCLGLWFVSKKIKARLYLFNLLGIINFAKKGVPIYMQVGKLLFFLSTWHFEIFFIIYLLHFCPFYRTAPIWRCFGNLLAHHKLDIKTFLRLKGGHQK